MSFWVAKKHERVTSSKSQLADMDQMTLTIIRIKYIHCLNENIFTNIEMWI